MADHRVLAHLPGLGVVECAGLTQHVVFDPDLSDVMQQGRPAQTLSPLSWKAELVRDLQAVGGDPGGVSVGVGVAGVDGTGEGLDGGEVGVLQGLGLFLKAGRHQVEDPSQVTDLV